VWVVVALDFADIVSVECVESLLGGVQGRQGIVEDLIGLSLRLLDTRRLLVNLPLLIEHDSFHLVRLETIDLQLLDQDLLLDRLLFQDRLQVSQLRLQSRDDRVRLEEFTQARRQLVLITRQLVLLSLK
jgi:hypothetical protein